MFWFCTSHSSFFTRKGAFYGFLRAEDENVPHSTFPVRQYPVFKARCKSVDFEMQESTDLDANLKHVFASVQYLQDLASFCTPSQMLGLKRLVP